MRAVFLTPKFNNQHPAIHCKVLFICHSDRSEVVKLRID